MISNRRHTLSTRPISQSIGALVFACGLGMSMPSIADDARQIAARHGENWNQSLQSDDVDELVALYASPGTILIAPGGQIAASSAEIAAFWQKQLKAQKVHANFKLLSAHFIAVAGQKPEHALIARYAVNSDERNASPLNFGKQPRWHVDAILKQNANGQWKTQLQHWY